MVNNMVETLTNELELETLRLINSVSFDFTFLFDCKNNKAVITKYVDGKTLEPYEICSFTEYLLSCTHPDDIVILEKIYKRVSHKEAVLGFEIRIKESVGRRYRWHSINMRLDPSGDCYVGSSAFVDNRKNKETELTIKARQDPLTGLLNKVVTKDMINDYIGKNPNEDCALIVFDIDNFKHYNDTMGHLFGDEIIKEVASTLGRIFSKDSFVGRVGGDEFLVLVKKLKDVSEIVHRMGMVRDSLEDITLGQRTNFTVTCSAGVSLFPDMGTDYDSLFGAADMALYSIKNNGRNSFAFYTDDLYDESLLSDKKLCEDESVAEQKEPYSLTSFAFRLLNDSDNIVNAINLLLYRIQTEYDLEVIRVFDLDATDMRVECKFELAKAGFEACIGKKYEFSPKAFQKREDRLSQNNGYLLYDFLDPSREETGYGVEDYQGVGSMLHIPMHLFGKNRGCIDLISRHSAKAWTGTRIDEIMTVSNLMAVCLYYSDGMQVSENKDSQYTNFDSLTGLMKEDFFIETATKLIASKASKSKLAVLYCDIVNFKYVNEVYGYVTGDRILNGLAEYMSSRITGVLCTGRFYSDNIISIVEFPKETSDNNLESQVEDINEMMSQDLSRRYNLNNIFVRTGVYIIPNCETDALLAVSNANMARKIAKAKNVTRCMMFDQEMFERRKRQIWYIQHVDEAIANKEFYVVMQPKVSGYGNNLVGAEALVRWKLQDGTEVRPDEFIPAFEKEGSIVKLDFFVYETVMKYIRDRIDKGKRVIPVSMNVSRVHLTNGNFVDKFKALIEKYQVPTQFLELELTESIYLENLYNFNDMIEELRRLGIKISMDDFGSGYSSLNALNDLKIDLLKIDKIFMRDESLKENDKTILRFIIDMAKNLSMKVLCEGVETKAQRDFLNEAGCDIHQGYLYSKPVKLPTFDQFLDHEDMLFAKVS